ncbi:hypothetical protein BDV95DRAFT_587665 [Massariosphaeria phaeospora]|uniref:Uncharacterized protein n=1 Tax=Massariosphaeria phaeospora TaxID=100035 RepID=A0A7C8HZV8_9PLEO|nr:hypothetical protein BDV95DRAFT_587665 [Massariosphaeria phaeospora]
MMTMMMMVMMVMMMMTMMMKMQRFLPVFSLSLLLLSGRGVRQGFGRRRTLCAPRHNRWPCQAASSAFLHGHRCPVAVCRAHSCPLGRWLDVRRPLVTSRARSRGRSPWEVDWGGSPLCLRRGLAFVAV